MQQSKGIDTKFGYNLDYSYNADAIVGKGNNLSDLKEGKIEFKGLIVFLIYLN
jgi:hypothetical protein